jgi:HNH endonuclease
MTQKLLTLVRQRARWRCEYCCLPQAHSIIPFEIDHILAKKHHGATAQDNLAFACFFCNSAKGPNVAGYDPQTGKLAPLFNPRRQAWSRHFRWDGPVLVGRTRIGRATIGVLAINDPDFVAIREALIADNLFPPAS